MKRLTSEQKEELFRFIFIKNLKEEKMSKLVKIAIIILFLILFVSVSSGENIFKLEICAKSKSGEITKINMNLPENVVISFLDESNEFSLFNNKVSKREMKKLINKAKGNGLSELTIEEKNGDILYLTLQIIKYNSPKKQEPFKKLRIFIKDKDEFIKLSVPISFLKFFSNFIKEAIEESVDKGKEIAEFIISPCKYFESFPGKEFKIISIHSSSSENVEISLLR